MCVNSTCTQHPSPWKLNYLNEDYSLCPSYPRVLCIPGDIDDRELVAVSGFRSEQRLPSLTWGRRGGAGSIWRSSQPKVGVSGASSAQDEKLLACVAKACALNAELGDGGATTPVVHIIDCRPRNSARANALTGHGSETTANYPMAKVPT